VVAPGGVATDFATRSLHFTASPDEDANPYASQMRAVLEAFSSRSGNASQPEQIAEVIYQAATDGSSQLRYIAGADAQGLLATKGQMAEADFMQMIQKSFGG
jgi:hypothetical protein